MTEHMTGLLIGAVIAFSFVALVVIGHTLITRYLFKAALEREEPPTMKFIRRRIMDSPSVKDAVAAMNAGAERLEAIPHTEVSIKGHDGEELIGHLYLNKSAKRVIIAMHGWRSSWSRDFGLISELFARSECTVLYIDQRGQNKSGGRYMTFGLHERYDCRAWVKWVNDTINQHRLPIYIAGVSMGAATVLMASGQKMPENVRGLIADCAFTSPHEIWQYVVKEKMRLSFRIRGYVINDIIRKKFNVGSMECSTTEALKNNTVPVLFIHGTADRLVPIEMTYKNYLACKAKKHLLVVPGADHGLSYYVDPARCEAAVTKFFLENDTEGAACDGEMGNFPENA